MPEMERFFLDLLRAVKKICFRSGMWECVEFVVAGWSKVIFFYFPIWSWGKEWEILLVVINKFRLWWFDLYREELKLRKLITNNWGHVSPGLVSGSGESFWSHFMGCIDVFLEKRRGDSGVKQVICIFLVEATRFLLVDCCGWVEFIGSTCVEIC